MKTRVDSLLRDEATRFALRFACEHCAHFDDARQGCSHGYPASPRKDALEGGEVLFCKEFEMGDPCEPIPRR
jgi:hypothetical protein